MISELERLCVDQKFKKKRLQNEDRKSILDLKTVLNFVESKNRKQSQTMKTAFSVAKDNGMNPIWITVDQALSMLNEIKNHVFIIESFRSELFEKLQENLNFHIYGPACIYYCEDNFYLPRRKFPIFNLCMRNLEICIDETFEKEDIIQLFGLINLMGGTFTLKFRPTITHLLSTNFSTKKSELARVYGIPIMNKDWIKECWELSLSKEMCADDKQLIDKFRLPIFTNFRMNSSQILESGKKKLENLIVQNGGECVDFIPRNVTHLILGLAKGEKYNTAKKYNATRNFDIKIVKQEWVYDSIESGYPLIEFDYLFESSKAQPIKFDFSAFDILQNKQQKVQSSQISSMNLPSSQIYSQEDQTNSQILIPESGSTQKPTQTDCYKPSDQHQTHFVKSKTQLNKIDNSNNSAKPTFYSLLTSSQNAKRQRTCFGLEDLESLVNQMDKNCRSSIFDGCEFYISDNFDEKAKVLLKRCITLQNGITSISLRESVNYVIVKENCPEAELMKLNQEFNKFHHTINQVNLKWIIQSCRSNKLVPLMKLTNLSESKIDKNEEERINLQNRISSQSQKRNLKLPKNSRHPDQSSISQQLSTSEIQPIREDEILNGYLDANVSEPCLSQTVQSKLENLKTILNVNEQTTNNNINKTSIVGDNLESSSYTVNNIKIDILNDDASCFKKNGSITNIPITWDDQRTNRLVNNESFSLPINFKNQRTPNTSATQLASNQIESRNFKQPETMYSKSIERKSVQSVDLTKLNRINFVGYSPEEKSIYCKELAKFNMKVIMDNDLNYDFLITQSNRLIKNECLFISIANGKWILHPDFYSKILELGRIPHPETYEWGSSNKYFSLLEPKFFRLAKSCRYWRVKVRETKQPAFTGQKLLIVSVNPDSYANIINNGGGYAMKFKLEFDNKENFTSVLNDLYLKLKQKEIQHFDYVLINYKKKELDKLDLLNSIKPIEELGIRCLHIDYVSQFLSFDKNLNIKNVSINQSSSSPSPTNLKRNLVTDDDLSTKSKIPNKTARK